MRDEIKHYKSLSVRSSNVVRAAFVCSRLIEAMKKAETPILKATSGGVSACQFSRLRRRHRSQRLAHVEMEN